MNHSVLAKKIEHPGLWGNEPTVKPQQHIAEETQLWAAISSMRQQANQWVTLIGKPSREFLQQLEAAGIPTGRIRCVTSNSPETAVWATEQALLLDNSQLVIAWLNDISTRDQKRLQLAARNSKSVNFLFTNSDTFHPLH